MEIKALILAIANILILAAAIIFLSFVKVGHYDLTGWIFTLLLFNSTTSLSCLVLLLDKFSKVEIE